MTQVPQQAASEHDGLSRLAEQLIGSGQVSSRPELAATLGVSPATASSLVRRLIKDGIVAEIGQGPSSGGRRPRLLQTRRPPGYYAVAELGGRHAHLGLCNGRGELLTAANAPLEIEAGPSAIIGLLQREWASLVAGTGQSGPLRGAGVALPGPVDATAGEVVFPARMPGWHGAEVTGALEATLGVPALVENDARAGGLGEWARRDDDGGSLLYVKAGTGIGGAWVVNGEVHRGASGLAGDVTHSRVAGAEAKQCSCGNTGCLETVASGAAVRSMLAEEGIEVKRLTDVVNLAADGHPIVMTRLRQAGTLLGEALAPLVNFLNPDVVVLGGVLSSVDGFVAGVRSEIYDRCLPMCTHDLVIERSLSGADAALLGVGALLRTHSEADVQAGAIARRA